MTRGGGYRGGRDDAASSRQRPAPRIGWGAAGRLVDGDLGGDLGGVPGVTDLDTLLAIASAPASEATLDPARLEPILVAFRGAAIAAATTATVPRSETRPRPQVRSQAQAQARARSPRAALVKCAAAFLVVGGSGVAAASAGVLPTSVQRIAHDYFGGVGIPAPSSSEAAGSNPSATPGAPGSAAATPGPGEATAGDAAQLLPLCRQVAANPQNWRTVLDAADQAALVAVAGDPGHVRQYCATALALPSSGPSDEGRSAEPSPAQSAGPASSADPEPSETHGNGHASHSPSPNPHSTGH
jgi:hypothetical protein